MLQSAGILAQGRDPGPSMLRSLVHLALCSGPRDRTNQGRQWVVYRPSKLNPRQGFDRQQLLRVNQMPAADRGRLTTTRSWISAVGPTGYCGRR